MGKQGTSAEQKKPAQETKEAPKGGAPAHSGAAHGGTSAPIASRGNVGSKVGCLVLTCKDKDSRASFCSEHFRQFKFGLVTKTGQFVSDYERKLEHYQNWLRDQKVA